MLNMKKKERQIVSWSKEEDDILREHIGSHGTNNWAIIASKFEDKTTRQCRRRWFTYLNSDVKRGGWTPEEDTLLCEAQKRFGNRWIEIAKVVSGRTDNAVKNRFSVLLKKRAKDEESNKENNAANVHISKRKITNESKHPMKRRKHIAATTDCKVEEGSVEESRTTGEKLRPPFALLVQNCHNTNTKTDASNGNMVEGNFLKKDDPKIFEPLPSKPIHLTSLVDAVTDQGNFCQNGIRLVSITSTSSKPEVSNTENNAADMNVNKRKITDLETSKHPMKMRRKHVTATTEDCKPAEGPVHESRTTDRQLRPLFVVFKQKCHNIDLKAPMNASSGNIVEENFPKKDNLKIVEPLSSEPIHPTSLVDAVSDQEILPSCNKHNNDAEGAYPLPNSEFNSPLQVTPLFRSMAQGIPSPQFSESEKNFLLKTLGVESTPPNTTGTSQSPPCKKALLHCL